MPPPQYKKYPLDQTALYEFKKQITELLNENKIWVSDSPCAAPIFFAKNKDEQSHLCIDYHVLIKK